MSDLKDKSWWLSNLYHPCEHLFPLVEEEDTPPDSCPVCAAIAQAVEEERKQLIMKCISLEQSIPLREFDAGYNSALAAIRTILEAEHEA